MGIASQTVKACAQYFYSKSSQGLMLVSLPQASLLPGAVSHPSSRIVKIGCWLEASRITQSVVQPMDSVDIERTAEQILTGILPSSSQGISITSAVHQSKQRLCCRDLRQKAYAGGPKSILTLKSQKIEE
ncbi:hypothetical protein TNCT_87231 [Trichonephila clavata]|uniref:Uncharacterized protein n=1 Tax=Trichonephila clavata TaxID=2740835 RepID=A0A8X6LGA4_TRICU|nr:hypothetical protein TNCT_87231 [Trichonephila clavata]